MFTNKTPTAPTQLDEAIEKLLTQMSNVRCDSEEYSKMADQLVKLYKAREIDANFKLKEIESLVKQEETSKILELKQTELNNKQTENAKTLTLKEAEVNGGLQLKKFDSDLKEREIDATTRLREIETELKQKDVETHGRVSRDTLALVAANIAGIVLIIGYERFNVITSKALGFVTKFR